MRYSYLMLNRTLQAPVFTTDEDRCQQPRLLTQHSVVSPTAHKRTYPMYLKAGVNNFMRHNPSALPIMKVGCDDASASIKKYALYTSDA